jgi:hypothetical protein
MPKAILLMLLTVVSSSAAAEWVEVGRAENITFYADPATIRRSGDLVKMWELHDLKTRYLFEMSKPVMSYMSKLEYDCKEEQSRQLYLSGHSGNMLVGERIFTNDYPDTWHQVVPGTITETLWKFACGKP